MLKEEKRKSKFAHIICGQCLHKNFFVRLKYCPNCGRGYKSSEPSLDVGVPSIAHKAASLPNVKTSTRVSAPRPLKGVKLDLPLGIQCPREKS